MWVLDGTGTTNTVIATVDGIISVTKPDSVQVKAYVNNAVSAVHHVHVKAGDSVHFVMSSATDEPSSVVFDYAGTQSNIIVPARMAEAEMENYMTPAETVNMFANPGSGGMGAGLGAGVLGGVLGGALLGGNRGGLFGNNGGDGMSPVNSINTNTDNAVAAAERMMAARFDAESQREIQAAIERTAAATQLASATQAAAVSVSVVKGQGEITTQVALAKSDLGIQSALNAAATQTLVQKNSGDLSTQVALNTAAVATAVERTGTATAIAFKDLGIQNVETKYATFQAIKSDGDATRTLINKVNDDMLNRLLTQANNELAELRNDHNGYRRSREVEVNVSQNVNQVQAQQQQQQQYQLLSNLAAQVTNLANDIQVVRQTQSNVNFGIQGTAGQTASAANTRVN